MIYNPFFGMAMQAATTGLMMLAMRDFKPSVQQQLMVAVLLAAIGMLVHYTLGTPLPSR